MSRFIDFSGCGALDQVSKSEGEVAKTSSTATYSRRMADEAEWDKSCFGWVYPFRNCAIRLHLERSQSASKAMNASNLSPSAFDESSERAIGSECDKKRAEEALEQQLNSETRRNQKKRDESDSESETEIDLTTTASPNNFVLVNGCIDFSNNNNNNNSANHASDKWSEVYRWNSRTEKIIYFSKWESKKLRQSTNH